MWWYYIYIDLGKSNPNTQIVCIHTIHVWYIYLYMLLIFMVYYKWILTFTPAETNCLPPEKRAIHFQSDLLKFREGAPLNLSDETKTQIISMKYGLFDRDPYKGFNPFGRFTTQGYRSCFSSILSFNLVRLHEAVWNYGKVQNLLKVK